MIYILLKWVCISIFTSIAEPILLLKRIGFKDEDYDSYSKVKKFIHRGIYCPSCLGFWITLIGTYNIELSIIISVITNIVDNKLIR